MENQNTIEWYENKIKKLQDKKEALEMGMFESNRAEACRQVLELGRKYNLFQDIVVNRFYSEGELRHLYIIKMLSIEAD